MTVLGKILVFVVLVLSLLWTFLTASAFAARTNWQVQSKRYQEEATKAGQAATAMKALLDSEREASAEQARAIREDRDRANQLAVAVQKERDGLLDQYNKLLDSAKKQSAEVAPLIGQKEKLIAEVGLKDQQIQSANKRLDELTLSEQAAVVRASQQANEAKAQADRANTLADRVQRLDEALEGARRAGVAGPRAVAGAGGVRVPAPEGLRGTVTRVDRNGNELYVTINVGLDVNLQKNTELTLFRADGSRGTYLGKLFITESDPKQAGGRFIAPAGVRLPPDRLPRAGDTAVGSSN